jgi:hypothetical protein
MNTIFAHPHTGDLFPNSLYAIKGTLPESPLKVLLHPNKILTIFWFLKNFYFNLCSVPNGTGLDSQQIGSCFEVSEDLLTEVRGVCGVGDPSQDGWRYPSGAIW